MQQPGINVSLQISKVMYIRNLTIQYNLYIVAKPTK